MPESWLCNEKHLASDMTLRACKPVRFIPGKKMVIGMKFRPLLQKWICFRENSPMKKNLFTRSQGSIPGNTSHGKRGHFFEDARVYCLDWMYFKRGAAMTIPGLGIFTGRGDLHNMDLLRHEYGHILQYRKWGARAFWLSIAPTSLKSAYQAHKNPGFRHMNTWTEWTANRLAYDHFGQPSDWNTKIYPLAPPDFPAVKMPRFAAGSFVPHM